jgi:cysteine-rich repeat protein
MKIGCVFGALLYVFGSIECGEIQGYEPTWCGDGIVGFAEECDDGAENSDTEPGACRTSCLAAFCGDGVVDPTEACDDGDGQGQGPCRADCMGFPTCGDGVLDEDEQCDEGADNSDTRPGACRRDCRLPHCGDGVLDGAESPRLEQCDDGNVEAGDGCSVQCLSERCGDAVLDDGEQCDDGNRASHDRCSSLCFAESLRWRGLGEEASPAGRRYHAMTYDASRARTVVYGGWPAAPLSEVWEFDGGRRQWTVRYPLERPPAQLQMALSFYPPRGTSILFGGRDLDAQRRDETWEYDGHTLQWRPLSVPVAPSARDDAAVTYDASRQLLVLFGGEDDSGLCDDTWLFDGSTWQPIATPDAPSPRRDASLVFVPGAGRILLFGGADGTSHLRDLWSFDGSTWAHVQTISVQDSASEVRLVLFPETNVLALLSGNRTDPCVNTWEQIAGGSLWFRHQLPHCPPGRIEYRVVAHAHPPQLVLFGGSKDGGGDPWDLSEGSHTLGYLSYWPTDTDPLPDEQCSGGFDEDHDGLVDCADPDCRLDPQC